jgi:hypothetical protein
VSNCVLRLPSHLSPFVHLASSAIVSLSLTRRLSHASLLHRLKLIMGNALGADAQGNISTYHAKVSRSERIHRATFERPPFGCCRDRTLLTQCCTLLAFVCFQAWAPYLKWAGEGAAPQLVAGLQSLGKAKASSVTSEQLVSALGLTPAQCGPMLAGWERLGPAEVLAPILRSGVSTADFLIVLNILVEEEVSNAEDPATAQLEGVGVLALEKVQEALDQIVEARGPQGENEVVPLEALTQALASVPLVAWAALSDRMVRAIQEQEMGGAGSTQPAAAAAAASAAPAAAASSASAASSSSAAKKPAAKSSSSGMGGGMGGGLDLSISGFSIKPPGKAAAGAGAKK